MRTLAVCARDEPSSRFVGCPVAPPYETQSPRDLTNRAGPLLAQEVSQGPDLSRQPFATHTHTYTHKMSSCFRRGRRRNTPQQTRSYSAEETAAWRERPYGCHDMDVAIKLYRENQKVVNLPENSFLRVSRGIPVTSYPEWCFRHEHPLKVGRKHKLYHRSDVVGPIVDSMVDLHDRNGADAFGLSAYIASKRRKSAPADTPLNQPKRPHPQEPVHAWTCKGCGSHSLGTLILGHEGYTCPCGVWAGNQIVGANRQKLGAAEEDDKTVTADKAWRSKTDKYDRPPETAKEARAARLARARTGGGLGGRRAGQRMGRLCDVQAITEREAAKSIVEAEVAAGVALHPRDRVKQRSVLAHVEEIFRLVHPVDHVVKRAVRIAADKTYISAVQHCAYCERRDLCEVRLSERHAAAIAQAVFEYTVHKLCEEDGADADLTIDMERVHDLRDRMSRTTAFTTRTSATQLASSKLMVSIINSPDFDFKKQCEKCEDDMPILPVNFATAAGPPIVSSLNS